MKKLFSLLLTGLLVFIFTACNQQQQPSGSGVSSGAPASSASSGASSAGSSKSSSGAGLTQKKKPTSEADVLESIDYEATQNKDTMAWLIVPGTDINDSVLQSFDNHYYLRRDERKATQTYGCYFMDYECTLGNREVISPNSVIYGHSDLKDNPDGPKFSQLFRFTDQQFATNNPCLYFSTKEEYMIWQIFAVYYTGTDMPYVTVNPDGAKLEQIVAEAKRKSLYQYDVPVTGQDKIVTLSTCTIKYGERTDQRFVVMAKLMGKEEAIPVTAPLTVNASPEQPSFVK